MLYTDIIIDPAIANDTAIAGDSHTIIFEVGSHFEVNAEWTFNGDPVQTGEKYSIFLGSIDGSTWNVSLTINRVEYNTDLGLYNVTVSNVLDFISGTFNLTTIEGNGGWMRDQHRHTFCDNRVFLNL